MNLSTPGAALADVSAPQELVDAIRTAFRTGGQGHDLLVFTMGAAVLAALVMLLARILNRERTPRSKPRPDYMTIAADVLGLAGQERRDLQRIIARARLAHPVSALLSPANLAHAVGQAGLNQQERAIRARLNNLCLKLFAVPLPEIGSAPAPD